VTPITTPRKTVDQNILWPLRLFMGVKLIYLLIGMVPLISILGEEIASRYIINIIANALLLGYLYSPMIARHAGKHYLFIALIILTILIIGEKNYFEWWIWQIDYLDLSLMQALETLIDRFHSPLVALLFSFSSTTALFVPLVFTSWKYHLKGVFWFITLTSLFELALLFLIHEMDTFRLMLVVIGMTTRNASFIVVGYVTAHLAANHQDKEAALQKSNRELVQYAAMQEKLTISQERNRLARELHDTIAHTMSGVTVKLNAVHILMQRDPDRASAMLQEVIGSLNEGNQETRRALRDLRATPLDDMGLVLAVRHLAESAAERGGLLLTFRLPTHEVRFTPEVELGIYRVAQEALTNIVEHANARNIRLTIRDTQWFFSLHLEDDGVGLPKNHDTAENQFGLQGMQERAAILGADLKITSAPGTGTQVQLTLEKSSDD
jgi:signal transduction histidine kinase